MSDDKRKEIAKAKFITGVSIKDIAEELGVNRRTIERWARSDGDWRDIRDSDSNTKPDNNVIPIAKKTHSEPKPRYTISRARDVDDVGVVEAALSELHASLPEAEDKSKGGIAVAIARLVELKRKIKPETVADLVERAIEIGIGPDEFLKELKNAWARRA